MKELSIDHLLEISIELSGEKDGNRLLELILTEAMDITGCDGGILYIKEGDSLAFALMITRSTGTLKGRGHEEISLPPVPITRANVCTCTALDGRLVNIPNVYETDQFDFSGPRQYDSMTGCKTTSMLVVPMKNDKGQVIGVLQLINALDEAGATIPFPPRCEQVILALSSLAAISLTNMNYAGEVRDLLDSLVGVLSAAIDARTPYNANHTRNMARYGERFLDWLGSAQRDWNFTEQGKRQFLMSVWLHDVGKLTTPLSVMDKESRLGAGLERVVSRLEKIALLARIYALEHGEDAQPLLAQLAQSRALIEKVNTAGFLPDDLLAAVQALAPLTYQESDGTQAPWLTADELCALSMRKGTLTDQERGIMESHVTMTSHMLSQVKFSEEYNQVATWAGSHHEFLNGSGYPHQLAGDEICPEVRLLTILDIFDALTARDRPHKSPMPTEEALDILHAMAQDGQLDEAILALFEESRAWED